MDRPGLGIGEECSQEGGALRRRGTEPVGGGERSVEICQASRRKEALARAEPERRRGGMTGLRLSLTSREVLPNAAESELGISTGTSGSMAGLEHAPSSTSSADDARRAAACALLVCTFPCARYGRAASLLLRDVL